MKGFTALLIILILWYFAGMYRQPILLALAICMVVLSVVLYALAVYQKHRLKVKLPRRRSITFKKLERGIPLQAENTSLLPVNRYRVTLALRYTTDRKPVRKRFAACAGGRTMKNADMTEFFLQAPYCGVIDIRLLRLRVYDSFSVFSCSKRLHEQGQILVFPVEKKINLLLPSEGSYDNLPVTDTRSPKPGDDHSEVYQIREYQPGDPSRYIHHNYSAKTDSLWVKEYSKENDFIFDLYLDTAGEKPVAAEVWDAFYEIVYSVVLALIRKDIILHVHWFDREQMGIVNMKLTAEEDAAEMLARLYLADKHCRREEFAVDGDVNAPGAMVINTALEWYFSGQPVSRFMADNVETELSSLTFRL